MDQMDREAVIPEQLVLVGGMVASVRCSCAGTKVWSLSFGWIFIYSDAVRGLMSLEPSVHHERRHRNVSVSVSVAGL